MWERGFSVGPLDGKAARYTSNGFRDFTRDPGQITRWNRQFPRCNWGGFRPGVIVIDEDPKNGGNLDELDIPGLMDTLVVRTGSGGRHLYFEYSGAVRGKLRDHQGIDVKSWRSGYTVMPGGIHPDTGNRYGIERDLPISLLPGALLPLVKAPTYVPQPAKVSATGRDAGLVRRVESAGAGERNAVVYWAMCRGIERGSSSPLMGQIWEAALRAGLGEVEIETCLRSARRTIGGAA